MQHSHLAIERAISAPYDAESLAFWMLSEGIDGEFARFGVGTNASFRRTSAAGTR
jgi:hypothetical protein